MMKAAGPNLNTDSRDDILSESQNSKKALIPAIKDTHSASDSDIPEHIRHRISVQKSKAALI